MLNRNKPAMAAAADRTALALSYIRGPIVKAWARIELDALQARRLAGIQDDDELHWNSFRTSFLRAWRDINLREDAVMELENLSMVNKDLEEYISRFETLISQAGWA